MTGVEQARRDATRLPIDSIAQKLQETLGQRLTAFAVASSDPKAIGRYATGRQKPRDDTTARLRDLYVVTQILLARETAETVRAWMIGSNPLLEDRAPIELLHEDAGSSVRRAAGSIAPPLSGRQLRVVERAAADFVGV